MANHDIARVNAKKPNSKQRVLPPIGWREWVALPELGVQQIKVKVDTGARSSALHAFDIRELQRGNRTIIRFKVHPLQRDSTITTESEAVLLEYRKVRSSGGHVTLRPVIMTLVQFMQHHWPIELTLVGRNDMGFRMLLGREAVRRRFLVDAGRSYYGGKPALSPRSKKAKQRERRHR